MSASARRPAGHPGRSRGRSRMFAAAGATTFDLIVTMDDAQL